MLLQSLLSHIKEEKDNILRTKPKKSSIALLLCFFYIFLTCICTPSTTNALTIGKEKELAKKYMKAMKRTGLIIKDPIISNMVKNIGDEIVATLPPQPFEYSFYAFDVDTFNAFATPAANIFVNRGLITSLDTVDELAGILAHEAAHAAHRHVAQLIDQSKIVNFATLAGILAGVLIGSNGDGNVGQGVTMGAIAAGQSAMLTYTRAHEREADQKGFEYITKTSFSPTGLLTGLKKIRAADFYGSDRIPDYLKTHPGTIKRIQSLEIMLARYNKKSNPSPINKNSYNFDMIKYRILGLYKTSDEAEKIFTRLLQKNPDNAAYHYGYGLALAKQFKFDKANIHLKKALEIKLFDPLILLEIGNIYLH
ncbi:MAG: M48 family metalloprotease, partial [Desulfobacteraceae bacterium]|nr:M48 family metalloprotease [Desulfobacteraceae bacterium]